MKKRIISLAVALTMCLSLAITASAEDVSKSIELDGATFTVTGEAFEPGKELTVAAKDMADGFDVYSIQVHAAKDTQERFCAVLENGQFEEFCTREEAMSHLGEDGDWFKNGFQMDANTSRTFTLNVPEEYLDWTISIRISGKVQGTFQNIVLMEGDKEQQVIPEKVEFEDVKETDWFYRYVSVIVGANQMTGVDATHFDPGGKVTVAQVLTMATTIHSEANGLEKPEAAKEGMWSAPFKAYCVEHEIIAADRFSDEDMNRPATRFEMVEVFDAVAGPSVTMPINELSDGFISDLAEGDKYGEIVYKWYRAGLVTGDSGTHAFRGSDGITRAEVSVIMCRLSNKVEHELIPTETETEK